MQLSPVSATQIGDHRYDAELDDLSAAGQQKGLEASKALLAELDRIDTSKLGREVCNAMLDEIDSLNNSFAQLKKASMS